MTAAVLILPYVFMAGLGLCLGSFATAIIHRAPLGQSWIREEGPARSRCPSCGHTLGTRDLVPLFSYLLSRGRCRHCGHAIGVFYPLIELAAAAILLSLFYGWGFTHAGLPVYFAVPFLLAALVIDWRHMILPDSVNVALAVLGLAHAFLMGDLTGRFLAALVLTGVLWLVSLALEKVKGRPALGRGDLKFLPAAGLFLGLSALPSYFFLAGLLGIGTAVLKGKGGGKRAFPFGPALILSLLLHVFLTGMGFDYTW